MTLTAPSAGSREQKTKRRSRSGQENAFHMSAAMCALLFFCQLLLDD